MPFKAKVIKKFHYVKIHPVLHVQLGLAPANGMEHIDAKRGTIMQFDTNAELQEMLEIAQEAGGTLLQIV